MALPDLFPRKLTYEDYLLIPEDGQRHEILDGEHYVTAAPFVRHQRISSRLHSSLEPWVFERDLGIVLAAPVDVLLSPYDVTQPDLLFISKERRGILTEANVQGAPDLVVEILSGSTRGRDEGLKRECYERFGVREYWLVDPKGGTIRTFFRQGDRFQLAASLSAAAGDVLTTPLLPGLAVPLTAIFA